jgi:hypothetical protein
MNCFLNHQIKKMHRSAFFYCSYGEHIYVVWFILNL